MSQHGPNPFIEKCPACGADVKDDHVLFVCRKCWFQVPAKNRVKLYNMHHRNQDTTTLFAKVLANLRRPPAR
jgi:hypothetical protein